jgi:predicted Zn-dependent protease with MMP-like domain
MDWTNSYAPSLDDIRMLAEQALDRLPLAFRERLSSLPILVMEFPDDEIVEEMELETPFDLLGLYQGVDLTRKSISDVSSVPDMVLLFRRPILDLWSEGEDTLDALVAHVLIHEIGHHFGLSDEDMEALEAAVQIRSN